MKDLSSLNLKRFLSSIELEFSRFNPPYHDVNLCISYSERCSLCLLHKYFLIIFKIINFRVKVGKRHGYQRIDCLYKSYISLLRRLVDWLKGNTWKKLNSFGSDPKKNYVVLNKLMNRKTICISDNFTTCGTSVTDPIVIYNDFNSHFINHPISIHENIADSFIDFSYRIENSGHSMNFMCRSSLKASNIILSMMKNRTVFIDREYFQKLVAVIYLLVWAYCSINASIPTSFELQLLLQESRLFKKGISREYY